MNDTNDTILPLNKTENQKLAFIEDNFNQTNYNGGIFSLRFHRFFHRFKMYRVVAKL